METVQCCMKYTGIKFKIHLWGEISIVNSYKDNMPFYMFLFATSIMPCPPAINICNIFVICAIVNIVNYLPHVLPLSFILSM